MSTQTSQFHRSLTLAPIIFFGLAYMTPMGMFSTYGIAEHATQGMLPAAYVLALLVMSFTVYSYGQMVKAYPVAGSTYTYTQKSIHSNVGFLVGWTILLDYLFVPMINNLLFGLFLHAAIPVIPVWGWIVIYLIITAFINVLGIKVAANVNILLFLIQVLVLGLFIFLCIRGIMNGEGTGTLFSLQPFYNPDIPVTTVMTGAAILCFSFLGFDSITTLTEESVNPTKHVPKAMFFIILIGAAFFISIAYFGHQVFPDYTRFVNADTAAFEIAELIGGSLFSAIFLAGLIVGGIGAGVASFAGTSRLLYAMGRDGVLPKRIFGSLHPKFKTPVNNILIVSLVSLSAIFIDLVTAVSMVNFGALLAYTFVNLSVFVHYYVKKRMRAGVQVVKYLLIPLIGVVLNLCLMTGLDKHSLMFGGSWFVIGIIYLLVLTRMFKQKAPELHFEETDTISQPVEETKAI